MIIDFHIHMFLPRESDSGKIGKVPGKVLATDGTIEGTKAKMAEWGVDKAVVQHIAPSKGDSKAINEYAVKLVKDGFFYAYGAFHPDDPIEQLREMKESGYFSGIKLHPYIQGFDIGDRKRMYPIYEELTALKLPVLFHTGSDPFNKEARNAYPERLLQVRRDFPGLIMVGAHMGGLNLYDEAEKYIIGTEMYLDISDTVEFCSGNPEQYRRMLTRHDPNLLLFGSDCPMGHPASELDFLKKMNLSDDVMEKILYKNAQGLLGIC